MSCEFLSAVPESRRALGILRAMQATAPLPWVQTMCYGSGHDWLMLWGVGREAHARAREAQIRAGGHAALWDMGYFRRGKDGGYVRVSVDSWHPERWLDKTTNDPCRWRALGIELREDADPRGPIVLVGMSPKSHAFLGTTDWERHKFAELRQRFPDRKIVFRPKPGRAFSKLPCELARGPIQGVLRGASLVVCRHSNVACDAVVAGVPFECEEGAAKWLEGQAYTREVRQDFLYRLAWWQWLPQEARQAWDFLLKVTA